VFTVTFNLNNEDILGAWNFDNREYAERFKTELDSLIDNSTNDLSWVSLEFTSAVNASNFDFELGLFKKEWEAMNE